MHSLRWNASKLLGGLSATYHCIMLNDNFYLSSLESRLRPEDQVQSGGLDYRVWCQILFCYDRVIDPTIQFQPWSAWDRCIWWSNKHATAQLWHVYIDLYWHNWLCQWSVKLVLEGVAKILRQCRSECDITHSSHTTPAQADLTFCFWRNHSRHICKVHRWQYKLWHVHHFVGISPKQFSTKMTTYN